MSINDSLVDAIISTMQESDRWDDRATYWMDLTTTTMVIVNQEGTFVNYTLLSEDHSVKMLRALTDLRKRQKEIDNFSNVSRLYRAYNVVEDNVSGH